MHAIGADVDPTLRIEVPMLVPRGIVVHISASTFGDAKQIDSWHKQKGWAGIGYHRVILNGVRNSGAAYNAALDGTVENGRADTTVGAHCHAGGMNVATLGVCCIGTPDKVPAGATRAPANATTKPYMTQKQFAALVDLLARLCQRHGMNPQGTFTHPRTGAQVPVLTQHSVFDPGKPFCASVNLATLRTAVAQALAALPAAPARRSRGGRRAVVERFLLDGADIHVGEPEVDPPVGDVPEPMQPSDVGTLAPTGGTRRAGARRAAGTRKTAGARKTAGTRDGAASSTRRKPAVKTGARKSASSATTATTAGARRSATRGTKAAAKVGMKVTKTTRGRGTKATTRGTSARKATTRKSTRRG